MERMDGGAGEGFGSGPAELRCWQRSTYGTVQHQGGCVQAALQLRVAGGKSRGDPGPQM